MQLYYIPRVRYKNGPFTFPTIKHARKTGYVNNMHARMIYIIDQLITISSSSTNDINFIIELIVL